MTVLEGRPATTLSVPENISDTADLDTNRE
jgi:hypothetical protein